MANPISLIGAFARMFTLENRRNKVAFWINYEQIKHLMEEIDKEIVEEMDDF